MIVSFVLRINISINTVQFRQYKSVHLVLLPLPLGSNVSQYSVLLFKLKTETRSCLDVQERGAPFARTYSGTRRTFESLRYDDEHSSEITNGIGA